MNTQRKPKLTPFAHLPGASKLKSLISLEQIADAPQILDSVICKCWSVQFCIHKSQTGLSGQNRMIPSKRILARRKTESRERERKRSDLKTVVSV
jgi:hypothetical protein